MMLKKWILLLLASVFTLSACKSPVYNQTEGNVADIRLKAVEARRKSDNSAKPALPLLVKQGLYVDTSPVSLDRQPSWLSNHIVIRGDQLPFSYYSRTVTNGTFGMILTKYQTGLDQAATVSINYTGTIKGALDLLASKTGYVYTIKGRTVYWQAFVTKTFDIAFMPGGTDYLMGKPGGGSASVGGGATGGTAGGQTQNFTTSDSSDSEYSSISGKLSVWDDLLAAIKQMISPDGNVTVSQATTTVTVRDRPSNIQLVGQFIHNLNMNLSKQVLVKVQILEINLENDYNFGIDWQIIAHAFHNSPFVINGNYGTPITISNVFSGQTALGQGTQPLYPQFGTQAQDPSIIPSWTILFNALSQQGKTSVVTEPRVVCLNNQVSVIRIVSSEGYVASVQNTSTGGSQGSSAAQNTVTSQITPGTVVTGLTLYLLPKILGTKVYMQVNADISTNLGITPFTAGTGANTSTIQLPKISEKHFNQRSVIHSGDTLILSGFRQLANQANANQFLRSQSLGGKGSQQLNTETIILITPIILTGTA
jgi:type IVB pilus formation R64 PilN family outer membrane protein